MDVKSAFLNGELEETVFLQQPPGLTQGDDQGKVLRLNKALYGLRQAPRAWNAKMDASLHTLGFSKSKLEHAVYRKGDDKSFMLVGVYVDDLIITGTNPHDIENFKSEMQKLLKMSNLGLLSYYLGIEVEHKNDEIRLKDDSGTTDATLYQSIIGCLRYLVNTRPDIGYAVGIASRYMEAPTKDHWGLTKQILRYVQGTIRYGCCYK
jgi:hypothetical protein